MPTTMSIFDIILPLEYLCDRMPTTTTKHRENTKAKKRVNEYPKAKSSMVSSLFQYQQPRT